MPARAATSAPPTRPTSRRRCATASPRLDAIDQIGLVDDAWALGLAGAAPIVDALELIQRAPVDAAPELWGRIAERLTRLDAFYRGDPARQSRWRAYAIGRLAPVLARIGWQARDGEEVPVTVLRAELIEALGELGDAATIAEARRRYALRSERPGGVSGGVAQVDPRASSRATPTSRPGKRCAPKRAPSRRRSSRTSSIATWRAPATRRWRGARSRSP